MQRLVSILFVLFLWAPAVGALAQSQPIAVKPENLQWTDMKGMPGWQQAILVGDPDKPGPYVQRIKVPPNAIVPPHSHSDTENITVLSGVLGVGEGGKVDKHKGEVLGVGAFYLLPANTVHFAWAGPKGAILQIHGVGPAGIMMLDPAKP
jgi:quercetin dioxygenase-like cupin family protein